MKSLGRRVPAEWVAKEIKLKTKLEEPKVLPTTEDHLIVRFKRRRQMHFSDEGRPSSLPVSSVLWSLGAGFRSWMTADLEDHNLAQTTGAPIRVLDLYDDQGYSF